MSSHGIRIERPQADEPPEDPPEIDRPAFFEEALFWAQITFTFLFSGGSIALAAAVWFGK